MIKEDYVSFETAKLLKEKGFDVNCYTHYSSDGQNVYYNYQTPSDGINRPTLQMAMKWLREVHNFHIRIDRASKYWNYTIRKLKLFGTNDLSYNVDFNTYEKACEAAVKHCLEKLI